MQSRRPSSGRHSGIKVNPPDPWVLIAKFGKPIGIDGSIRVWTETDFSWIRECGSPLLLWRPPEDPREPLTVLSAKKNKESWTVRVEGFATREDAASLTNAWIVAKRDDLPEADPGFVYWDDLLGALVTGKDGAEIGIVTDIIETAAHTVIEVTNEKTHEGFLLPLTEEVDADFEGTSTASNRKILRVSLPDGMIEATRLEREGEGKDRKVRIGPRPR